MKHPKYIHTFGAAQVASELEELKERSRAGQSGAADLPAVNGLIDAALDAVAAAVPVSFEFAGRRYWVRLSIGLSYLEFFDNPTDPEPTLGAFSSSGRIAGHRPGH